MKLRVALLVSLLLHLTILLLIIISVWSVEEKKNEQQQQQKAEHKTGSDPVYGELVSPEQYGEKVCSGEQYVGIGIYSVFDRVTSVAPNGPADRAGIKAGDELTRAASIKDKYAVGTPIVIKVIRDGTAMTFNVIVDVICAEQ
jgi:C-terminal processing protease CtpA/Prc